jgi:hypothetical protein
LVVGGWWLLVNEGEGFRDGERCALRAHGRGRVLAKTLVVDGWWLLVNEGVCGLFVRRMLMIRFQLEFTPAQAGA